MIIWPWLLALPGHAKDFLWLSQGRAPWRMSFQMLRFRVTGIASRLKAIAIRLEAIATRVEAIAIRVEGIASRLEAMSINIFASYESDVLHLCTVRGRDMGGHVKPGKPTYMIAQQTFHVLW